MNDMNTNERIKIKKINDRVFLMDDAGQSTGYLVVGSEKALVIDTMNGVADVNAAARTITDLPIVVVNTHGHGDHILGNVFFDEAFLHPADLELAAEHSKMTERFGADGKRDLKMPPFKEINDGDVIDLGGVTIEVIALPGHTKGSILLLDKEDRILFTGDAINRHLWLQLDTSLPISECLENLGKVMYLTEKADYILHGHAKDVEPVSLMNELYKGLESLCKGDTAGDSDYNWFGGKSKQHPFRDGNSVIVYKP